MLAHQLNQKLIDFCFRLSLLSALLLIVLTFLRFFFFSEKSEVKVLPPPSSNPVNVAESLHEKYLKQKQLHEQWLENAKRLQYWSQQISNENRILRNKQKLAFAVRKANNEEIKQRLLQEKRENVLEIKRFKSKIKKVVVKTQKRVHDKLSFVKHKRK